MCWLKIFILNLTNEKWIFFFSCFGYRNLINLIKVLGYGTKEYVTENSDWVDKDKSLLEGFIFIFIFPETDFCQY